jgi:uncharacterized protein (AIM24 family)
MQPVRTTDSRATASFGTVRVSTSGELVPVTEVSLSQNDSIFFEHHNFLWKDPTVTITAKGMKGLGKRFRGGLPVFVTEAHGPGRIAFSRDAPGQIIFLDLKEGMSIHVKEHQFLLCTSGVNYSFFRVKRISNMLYGGTGFFIDRFEGPGLLALHGYGNVFVRNLEEGETIDVGPGGFLYKDSSVQMSTSRVGLKSGPFVGSALMNNFTGPGRLAIQSMPFHMHTGTKRKLGK